MTEIFATLAAALHINTLLQIVLGMIMLSVGLSLQFKNFIYVLNNRRLLFFGLSLKIILIPLLTWGIVALSGLSPLWQFGIMVMMFCPGGTTSNVITYWAGGTSALTIFLTVLSGFITLLTLPLFTKGIAPIYFGSGTDFNLPTMKIVQSISFIILLPAFAGMLLRRYYEKWAGRLENVLKKVSPALLGIVYLIKFFAPPTTEGSTAIGWSDIAALMPVLLLINFGGMLLAYFITRKRNIVPRDAMTIGIEMGIQNGGLAILIGDVLLANHEISKPALLYAMFSFWTTLAFAWWARRKVPKGVEGLRVDGRET